MDAIYVFNVLNSKDLKQHQLEQVLTLANFLGFTLVYWPAKFTNEIDDDFIAKFGGHLVDCKTSYGMPLTKENLERGAMANPSQNGIIVRSCISPNARA